MLIQCLVMNFPAATVIIGCIWTAAEQRACAARGRPIFTPKVIIMGQNAFWFVLSELPLTLSHVRDYLI